VAESRFAWKTCIKRVCMCVIVFCLDTLTIAYLDNGTAISVGVLNRNIAWSTDKDVKFRNPPESGKIDILYIFVNFSLMSLLYLAFCTINIKCDLFSQIYCILTSIGMLG